MKLLPLLLLTFLLTVPAPAPAKDRGTAGGGDHVYAVESIWRDGAGRTRPFSALAGPVRVLAMGYTSCQFACPRILADMRAIERGIGPELAAAVAFTFVSFDSARDTPAVLRRFQKNNALQHWTFLTGDADSALELSVVLGVKYQQVGLNDFAHSNTIFILAGDGRILHRQDNLGAKPDASIAAIRKALGAGIAAAAPTR